MRNIVGMIATLATIYFGAPKAADWIALKMKQQALEKIIQPRASLQSISKQLTRKYDQLIFSI